MSARSTVPLDDLLAHREWVRSLAHALTRDENEGDDVAQETWLAALRTRPASTESTRGWLAAVARNAARRRHRTRTRSARRDAVAARPDRAPGADPAELAARAELHARVAAAVVALDEPYRTAVLLRHFEGLPVAQVAERLGVPLESARARLRRGRATLRARLERELGAAGGLASALLPLTRDVPVSAGVNAAAAGAGGILMTSKPVVAAIALVCVAVGAAWWLQRAPTDPVASAPETASVPPADVAEHSAADAPPAGEDPAPRRRVERGAPPAAQVEEVPPARPVVPVADLLDSRLDYEFAVDDVTLRRTLGLVAGRTQVPIVVDARLSEQLDSATMTLRLSPGVSARTLLHLIATMQGDAVAVEPQRVVLHGADATWEPDLPVVAIAPVVPDPGAPSVLRIHGHVRGADGLPVADARICVDGADAGRSDASGAYAVEVRQTKVRVTASVALRLAARAADLSGELGGDVEHDFVVGGPAGALDVLVRGGPDALPLSRARVNVSWERDSDGAASAGEVRLLTDDDGRAGADTLPPGALTIRISALSHAPETREVHVAVGATARLELTLRAVDLAERLREIRVTCRFEDSAPRQIITYLRTTTGVAIAAAPDCAARLMDVRVSLDLADATLERALTDLCAAAGDLEFDVARELVILRARRR